MLVNLDIRPYSDGIVPFNELSLISNPLNSSSRAIPNSSGNVPSNPIPDSSTCTTAPSLKHVMPVHEHSDPRSHSMPEPEPEPESEVGSEPMSVQEPVGPPVAKYKLANANRPSMPSSMGHARLSSPFSNHSNANPCPVFELGTPPSMMDDTVLEGINEEEEEVRRERRSNSTTER